MYLIQARIHTETEKRDEKQYQILKSAQRDANTARWL